MARKRLRIIFGSQKIRLLNLEGDSIICLFRSHMRAIDQTNLVNFKIAFWSITTTLGPRTRTTLLRITTIRRAFTLTLGHIQIQIPSLRK